MIQGVSLIIFPEAKRTRDGHLNEFEDGGFRLGATIGRAHRSRESGRFISPFANRGLDSRPTTIRVILHDTIETKGMRKEDVPALKARVKQIIEASRWKQG